MCTEPFGDYLALIGRVGERWPFEATMSALWRGYQGRWEVIDGRLYLLRLGGKLREGGDATLQTFFPQERERVFAHWFSGEARIELGERVEYVHQGYQSRYERNLLLTFERGLLVSEQLIEGI